MAKLADVLGAIIGQIGHGRAQADLTSVDIAQLYIDHPMLAEFPVPRLELSQVTVELRLAVNGIVTSSQAFSPESKAMLTDHITTYVHELPEGARMAPAMDRYPALKEQWEAMGGTLVSLLAEQVPVAVDVDARMLGALLASLLQQHVDTAVRAASADAAGPAPQERTMLAVLAGDVTAYIAAVLPEDTDSRALTPEGKSVLRERVAETLNDIPGADWAWRFFSRSEAEALWDRHLPNLQNTIACVVPVYTPVIAEDVGEQMADILEDHMRAILGKVYDDRDLDSEGNELRTMLEREIEALFEDVVPKGETITQTHAEEMWKLLEPALLAIPDDSPLADYFKRFDTLADSWAAEQDGVVMEESIAFAHDNGDSGIRMVADEIAVIIVEALIDLIERLLEREVREFGVPGDLAVMFMDELNAVLDGYPAAPDMTELQRTKLVNDLVAYVDRLPSSRAAKDVGLAAPAVAAVWKTQSKAAGTAVSSIIPNDRITNRSKVASGVASVIAGNITAARAQAMTSAIVIPNVQQEARGQLLKLITDTLRDASPATTGMDVAVTAEELSMVAPEQITTMKLELCESDMSWVRTTGSNGVIHSRLVT